jgi:hypothetical protein
MRCDFSTNTHEGDFILEGYVVSWKDTFWYLGSMVQQDEGIDDEDVSHRIKRGGWSDTKQQEFIWQEGTIHMFSLKTRYTIW